MSKFLRNDCEEARMRRPALIFSGWTGAERLRKPNGCAYGNFCPSCNDDDSANTKPGASQSRAYNGDAYAYAHTPRWSCPQQLCPRAVQANK